MNKKEYPFNLIEKKQKKGNKKLKKDILIEDLEFSVRTYNCLKRSGINAISDILEMTDEELHKVRNLSVRSFDEIKDKLADYGLSLKEATNVYFSVLFGYWECVCICDVLYGYSNTR